MCKPKTVDPVTLLPFVKHRPNWKPGDGRFPRDFWAVEASGDYGADCETGGEFARVALDNENFPVLLGWVVLDMVDKGKESLKANNGLIVGFMTEIARHAAYGRKILKAAEEEPAGTTIAIMKANGNRLLLGVGTAYPEAEIRRPV